MSEKNQTPVAIAGNTNPVATPVAVSPVQNQTSKPAIAPKVIKIQAVNPSAGKVATTQSADEAISNKVFSLTAKNLETGVDTFVGILDSSVVKATGIAASIILEDDETGTKLAEKVGFSDESRLALKVSGSRLLAKHCPDNDFVDWMNVGAAVSQMGIGLALVAKELVAIKKLKIKELELKSKLRP